MLERDPAGVKRDLNFRLRCDRADRRAAAHLGHQATGGVTVWTQWVPGAGSRSVGYRKCFSALHELKCMIEIDNPGVRSETANHESRRGGAESGALHEIPAAP